MTYTEEAIRWLKFLKSIGELENYVSQCADPKRHFQDPEFKPSLNRKQYGFWWVFSPEGQSYWERRYGQYLRERRGIV